MKFKCQCGNSIEVADDKAAGSVTCPACGMAVEPAAATVKVKCRCGKVLEIAQEDLKKKVPCPSCGGVITPSIGVIKFRCHCGKVVEVPQNRAGQMYVCPFCNLTMLIPFAHEKAPFREEEQNRHLLRTDGASGPRPLWVNAWLDSQYWPKWVKFAVVAGLLLAILIPVWIMVSGSISSGGSRVLPSPPPNPIVTKVESHNTVPAPAPHPVVKPPPAKKNVNPPPPPPPPPPRIKVYGEDSFNVITGVSAGGKHFDLQGYTPRENDTSPAYQEGAALVIGIPQGVRLPGGAFSFGQVIVADKKDGRVWFRAATPRDKIRLRQVVNVLGRDYGPGDLQLPADGKIEDHRNG